MSLFKNFVDNMSNLYNEKKANDAADREYVNGNIGSKAIAAYIATLFEKGNSGYTWYKENKNPLNIKVEEDSVVIFYTYYNGNANSFRDALPKDIPVSTFSFEEMYQWYGCSSDEAFHTLPGKVKRKTLEVIIHSAIEELPHMKYNGGWVVRMFQ